MDTTTSCAAPVIDRWPTLWDQVSLPVLSDLDATHPGVSGTMQPRCDGCSLLCSFSTRPNAEQILSSATRPYFNSLLTHFVLIIDDGVAGGRSEQGVAPALLPHLPPRFARQPRVGKIFVFCRLPRHNSRLHSHVLVFHAVPSPPGAAPCQLVQSAASAGFALQTHR